MVGWSYRKSFKTQQIKRVNEFQRKLITNFHFPSSKLPQTYVDPQRYQFDGAWRSMIK